MLNPFDCEKGLVKRFKSNSRKFASRRLRVVGPPVKLGLKDFNKTMRAGNARVEAWGKKIGF